MSIAERVRRELREIGLAFVVFNGAAEIDRRLGEGGLRRLFFSRRVEGTGDSPKREVGAGSA
jgi:hypothetical protein